MLSNNPRLDYFRLVIPDDFFIPEIVDKYNLFIRNKPQVIDSIQTMLVESIQSFDTPEFGFEPTSQIGSNAMGSSQEFLQTPKISEQRLGSQRYDITFRHGNGFMTYFLMMEHFFIRHKMGPEARRNAFGTVVLETLMPGSGQVICRIKFKGSRLISIPSLNFSYGTPARDLTSFTCGFAFNEFETTFELPDLQLTT